MYNNVNMPYCPYMQWMYMAPNMYDTPRMMYRQELNSLPIVSVDDELMDEIEATTNLETRANPNKFVNDVNKVVNEGVNKVNEGVNKVVNQGANKINEGVNKVVNQGTNKINEGVNKIVNQDINKENVKKVSNENIKVQPACPPPKHGSKLELDTVHIDIILKRIQDEEPLILEQLVSCGVPHHTAIEIIKKVISVTLLHHGH